MTLVPDDFSLDALQRYVEEVEVERGFDHEDALHKCLLLGEEVGELFKAVRRVTSMRTDPASAVHEVGQELADVLNFVLALANRFDLVLSKEYAKKEALNRQRSWT